MRIGCGCGGCFTRLFLAVFVLGVATAASIWYHAHKVAPWAYGKPPLLTGTWVGAIQTPAGQSGMIELKISRQPNTHRDPHPSSNGRAQIEASSSICGLTPGITHMRFYGSANRTADDVFLEPDGNDTRNSGIDLETLHGAWLGDTLRLTTTFFNPQGSPDSTTLVLHSAPPTTLLANCWQVPASKRHQVR